MQKFFALRILKHKECLVGLMTIHKHNCGQMLVIVFSMRVGPLIKVRNGLKSLFIPNYWHGEEKKHI